METREDLRAALEAMASGADRDAPDPVLVYGRALGADETVPGVQEPDELCQAPGRRSGPLLLMAAAVAVLIVGTITVFAMVGGDEDGSPVITDATSTTSAVTTSVPTPTATSTTLPSVDDAAPAGSSLADLVPMRPGDPFPEEGERQGVVVRAIGDAFYALEPFTRAPLVRSDDGATWEPVPETVMRHDGTVPSWFSELSEDAEEQFWPAAFEVAGSSMFIVEIRQRPAAARIWISNGGDSWTMSEYVAGLEPIPDAVSARGGFGDLMITSAASPELLIVDGRQGLLVDWRQYLPVEDWADAVVEQYQSSGLVSTPVPGPTGLTIQHSITDPDVGMPSFIGWEDLPPEAEEMYAWLQQHAQLETSGNGLSGDLFTVTIDGVVAEFNDPDLNNQLDLDWTGSRFVAQDAGGVRSVSTDGTSWDPFDRSSYYSSGRPLDDGAMIALMGPHLGKWGEMELLTYPAGEATATTIDVDLPGWGSGRNEWRLLTETVQHGRYAATVVRVDPDVVEPDGSHVASQEPGQPAYLTTGDGANWDVGLLETDTLRDPTTDRAAIAIAPDGTLFIHWSDGSLDTVRPPN